MGPEAIDTLLPNRDDMRLLLLVVVTWAVLLMVGLTLSRSFGVEMPTCLFRRMTGQPCAACGGTRATILLAQGQFGQALRMNPLVAIAWFGVPGIAAWLHLRRRGGASRITPIAVRRLWIIAGLLLAANWAYLLLWGVAV